MPFTFGGVSHYDNVENSFLMLLVQAMSLTAVIFVLSDFSSTSSADERVPQKVKGEI